MGAIVDDRRGALAGARFGEVDPDALAAALDEVGADAFGAEGPDGAVADGVRRETGHVAALEAELREAHRDVGLAAAVGRDEGRGLEEALEARRAQAQHDLAERDDCGHGQSREAGSGLRIGG
jgi:hypothetical protein